MSDTRVYDRRGTLITVGCRVTGTEDEPGGVVTAITPMDVDHDDETGQARAWGPFVHVLYDDDVTEEWSCWRDHVGTHWTGEFVCEDVEVLPAPAPPVRLTDEQRTGPEGFDQPF